MKKTILAAATLSVLMASGMANAAFTDADASGAWAGQLEFNGTITNTNPVWQYQIPDAAVAGAKNWDTEVVTGVVHDENRTKFVFPTKSFSILQGVMKAPSPISGAGMQPIVEVGIGPGKAIWDTTKVGEQKFHSSVPAKKGEDTVGTLSLTLWGEAASQALNTSSTFVAAESVYANVQKAFAILKAQPYYASLYSGKKEAPEWNKGASTGLLSDSGYYKISSAIDLEAGAFELFVPTGSIPDTWTATLPISITVK